MGYRVRTKEFTSSRVPAVTPVAAIENIEFESSDREDTGGKSDRYGPLLVNDTPTYKTCILDNFCGPGAMNATVEAVALLAATETFAGVVNMDTLSSLCTEQMPWNSEPHEINFD